MDVHHQQWREAIDEAWLADRFRLRRQLDELGRSARHGTLDERRWTAWCEALAASRARVEQRRRTTPILTYDESLPVAANRAEIAAAIAAHQVVVLCGETGSGKSTQAPKICLELGRGAAGMIGHTQPRRIAARSIAARLAEELGPRGGELAAYKIRFGDTTRESTRIKLVTDGMLLAETLHDRFLEQYDTLIIDEAHERSLNVDLLLGILARLLPRRPDLKVVLMSATIDAERFAEHFSRVHGRGDRSAAEGDADQRRHVPVLHVAGRSYPVEIRYRPPQLEDGQVECDPLPMLPRALSELWEAGDGDVLVFLPTERDIHDAMRLLKGRPEVQAGRTELLPLYARLSAREQQRIFQPHEGRRIVLATNVAESSLTVPGIRYVIDTGLARISRYAPRGKVQRLPVEPISRASADQRAGRCGRLGPGICIRLYSEEDYREREAYTTPEIRRTSLAGPLLQTRALRLGPLETLPLLDPPHSDVVRDGYHTLFEIGALDARREITDIGRKLARLPVDPRLGRMILAAVDEGCLRDVLVIAAALEIQDPRERPFDRTEEADRAHARFHDGRSDFLGLLKLWRYYQSLKAELGRNSLRKACSREFLSYARLREWSDIYRQLQQSVRQEWGQLTAAPLADAIEPSGANDWTKQEYAALHRAILAGLLSGVAHRCDAFQYAAAGGAKLALWPGAGPFASKPEWIVAAEVVETNRRYARRVARIDPRWVEPLAEHLVKRSYSDPLWSRSAGTVLATERVTLFGLPLAKRRTPYGPIDPQTTRDLFLRDGLVAGDIELGTAFFRHNEALRAELQRLSVKLRRSGLAPSSRTVYDFYHSRLPAEVVDVPSLHRWRRQAERTEPKRLWMTKADLVDDSTPGLSEEGHPDHLQVNEIQLPLTYRFEPGVPDDGITLTVPLAAVGQLSAARLDWCVPARVPEKVEALVWSLPKSVRRALPPTAEAVRRTLAQLRYGEGPFLTQVAAALSEQAGVLISTEQFQLDKLPHYLQLYVKVVDDEGRTAAAGRNIEALLGRLGIQPAPFREIPDAAWTRSGLKRWQWGDLPPEIVIERAGIGLPAFPTLIDRGDSVDLRLLDSRDESQRRTRRGIRRLFLLGDQAAIDEHVQWLPNLERWSQQLRSRLKEERLREQLALLIADRAFLADGPLPRSHAEFAARQTAGRQRIEEAVVAVAQRVGPIAEAYQPLYESLVPLAQGPVPDVARDVFQQLDRLFIRDFLLETPWSWLEQFPRYLTGALERVQRIGANTARDRECQDELAGWWQRYESRRERDRTLGRYDPELATYRWLLEEYRVSLFAQTLGTSVVVSPQRLERQWERVGRPT